MTDPFRKPVRVRFAPSPTGRTHLGSGRTALYNYLLARQTGGSFILRIEDTDRKRYVPGAETELMNSLHWLGLDWDEGPDVGGDYSPYQQTERKELYLNSAWELIKKGAAYYCFCEAVDDPGDQKQKKQHREICPDREKPSSDAEIRLSNGENAVIRFKMPWDGTITVTDVIRGPITVNNRTLDDYILIKSDGLPVYHLAVVVDDHYMKITHVIRTSEWLPTFPLHGHIYKAFGWEQPVWIHPSVYLKPDGKGKMSKRDNIEMEAANRSIFLGDMERLGYLPEAVVNWAILIGWSLDDKTEFFTMDDLIRDFSIEKLSPSPAAVNFSKLDHFNGLHIRNLSVKDLAQRLKPFFENAGYVINDIEKLEKVAAVLQIRLTTLAEAPEKAGFFFKETIDPDPISLIGKNLTATETLEMAQRIYSLIERLPDFSEGTANQPLRDLAASLGLKAGHVFSFMRNALTAEKITPPIFSTMEILGREIVLYRLLKSMDILRSLS
jgi:glutamyl-tRNA synthetase